VARPRTFAPYVAGRAVSNDDRINNIRDPAPVVRVFRGTARRVVPRGAGPGVSGLPRRLVWGCGLSQACVRSETRESKAREDDCTDCLVVAISSRRIWEITLAPQGCEREAVYVLYEFLHHRVELSNQRPSFIELTVRGTIFKVGHQLPGDRGKYRNGSVKPVSRLA